MVLPGIASHSPLYQSFTFGWEISSTVSCDRGEATMSICGSGRYFFAASLVTRASSLKMSQSVFDSHTGAIAADSG